MPAADEAPQVQRLLHETVEHLSLAGVRWTLLRMPSHPAAPVGDVDLLIDPRDVALFRALLDRRGFRRLPYAGVSTSYLTFDAFHDEWLWLDVATAIAVGGRRLPRGVAAAVVERSRPIGVLRVPSPADAFWLLVLHLIDVGTSPRSHHRAALIADSAATGVLPELEKEVLRLLDGEWTGERLRAAVASGAWDQVEPALARARASAWGKGRLTVRALRGLSDRIPTRARRGMSVALLGPDGAGKSTLAGAIRDAFVLPVHVVYMGTGLAPTGSGSGRARLLRFLSHSPIDPLGALLTQWWRCLAGAYHRARGRVVVFDRYTEDALLPPPRDLSRVRRITRLLRRVLACPAPDLAVILDAPGLVMYQRKGEHDPLALETARKRYLALRHAYPRALVLDATLPTAVLRQQVTLALWNLYRARLPSPRR